MIGVVFPAKIGGTAHPLDSVLLGEFDSVADALGAVDELCRPWIDFFALPSAVNPRDAEIALRWHAFTTLEYAAMLALADGRVAVWTVPRPGVPRAQEPVR